MFTYIKTIFAKPKEIYTGRNMKTRHYFSLILLMGIVLTALSSFEIIPAAQNFSSDYEEIKLSIPDFELVNDELKTSNESYVYQTDSMVFYFDGNNKINTKTIQKNMKLQTAPISIGLLDTKLYFNFLGTEYSVAYSNLKNFTTNDLKNLLNTMNEFTPSMYLLFTVILIILNLFLYLTQLFPITLFANIISVYRKTGLKFIQTAKVALLASVGPFILMYIINAFNINVFYQFEIILFSSVLLFYLSMSEFKKRKPQQNET